VKLFFILIFILAAFFLSPSYAEKIIWGTTSFPPGYIIKGSDRGLGYGDQLDRYMMEKLPQYEHQIVEYPNWERYISTIKKGPLVCTSLFFYRPPELRETIKGSMLLSAPNGIFFLHDVIISKKKQDLFAEPVSFKTLLNNPSLTFGYNRPYGIIYDKILSQYAGIPEDQEFATLPAYTRLKYLRDTKNIVVRTSSNMITGMLKMLAAGKVDYILEYEFMVRYHKKRLKLADEFVMLPVSEGKNAVARLAYACSDSPQGEKAIAAINKVLLQNRNRERYKKNLDYLVPPGREALYWREYEKILNIDR